MARKDTKEKEQKIKNIRFEKANILMRRLFETSVSSTVGYSLFRDVIYKTLEEGNDMTTEEKIKWATSKFIFDISYEEALEEIYELVMRRSREKDTDENRKEALEETIAEAVELQKKTDAYELSTEKVKKLNVSIKDKRNISNICYEIARGNSAKDAIDIIARKMSDDVRNNFLEKREEIIESVNKAFSSLAELEKFMSDN